MKKRFLSLFLALTVCLALAVPAFATLGGNWDDIWWLMDSALYGGGGNLLELSSSSGTGTLSDVKRHVDADLEEWGLLEDYRQIPWFDVEDVARIADGAFEGYTQVKGIRIAGSVTEIGDIFGGTLSSLANQPVIIYGMPGSAAEDFVNRTNAKSPDALLFLDSSAYQLGEDPTAAPADACGENAVWSYDEASSTLTIRGTGSMMDFTGGDQPWMRENSLPRHIVIEEGITRIGNQAFAGNESLESVSLPGTLTAIGAYAFMNSGLASVDLPANLQSIGSFAFSECKNLTSIAFPRSIVQLTDDSMMSFKGSGLTSVYIPASMYYINDSVFLGCEGLTDVYYEGSEENWANIEIRVDEARYQDTATPNGVLSTVNIHYFSYTPEASANPPAPGQTAPGGLETHFYIMPTASTVLVDGAAVAFDAYNINGANYFKLRDLAMALNGSAKQFEVSWNAGANAIELTSGAAYTAVGGELAVGNGNVESFRPTDSKILLNGAEIALEAFNINGNNYFKLRDIGSAFDFGVDWDGAANTIVIDTTKGYTPD